LIIPEGHVGFWIFNDPKILNKVIKFIVSNSPQIYLKRNFNEKRYFDID